MKDEFDKLIEQAVKEEINDFPKPNLNASESWARIEQELNQMNLKPKRNLLNSKFIYFVAAALIFVSFSFILTPQKGSAFNSITEMFHQVQSSVMQLFVKVGGEEGDNENSPTSDEFLIVEDSEITAESMNLEEARKLSSFLIKEPNNLPIEFSLSDVIVIKNKNEKSKEVVLNYEGEQRGFKIWERLAEKEYGMGNVVDQEDTEFSEVNIKGNKGSLIIYKNGVLKLIWTDQNIIFVIEGQLTQEEIINIAKSI